MRATRELLTIAVAFAVLGCGPSGNVDEGRARDDAGARAEDSAAEELDEATSESGDFPSAAERTRAMEERAAALEREFREAMADATSEEERVRAYQEFERGREELNEMGEGDAGDDDAYGPPPEP